MTDKSYSTPPKNLASLSARIRNLAHERGTTELRLRGTIGNIIIGQMLPSGAIKGGTAMRLRHGDSGARFSSDVDVTRAAGVGIEEYVLEFRTKLELGWNGFAGTVVAQSLATPVNVPAHYIMAPFRVKLAYQGKSWFTVLFELGHEEIDSLIHSLLMLPLDIADLFHALGLPRPAPIAVLPLDHQIAQKVTRLFHAG